MKELLQKIIFEFKKFFLIMKGYQYTFSFKTEKNGRRMVVFCFEKERYLYPKNFSYNRTSLLSVRRKTKKLYLFV